MSEPKQSDPYRSIFERSPQPMLVVQRDSLRVLAINEAALRLLGCDRAEVLEGDLPSLADAGSGEEMRSRCAAAADAAELRLELTVRTGEGATREVRLHAVADRLGSDPVWSVGLEDLAERRRGEVALQRSEERFRAIFENSADVVVLADRNGNRLFVSDSVERVLGWTPEELLGRSIFDLVHPEDRARTVDAFADGRQAGGHVATLEFRARHRNGAWLDMEVTVSNLLGNPAVGAMVLHARDITRRKEAEDRIVELQGVLHNVSLVDPVSGLHNRRGFLTFGEHRLQLVDRLRQPMVLTILELHNLEEINAALGVEAGDRAIGELTDTLQATFRKTDILARLSGDTFGILALIRTPNDARFFLGRLFDRVEALNRQPGREYPLVLNVGNAVYDPRAPVSFSQLLGGAESTLRAERESRVRG